MALDTSRDDADGWRMLEALEERQLEMFAAMQAGLEARARQRAAALQLLDETRLHEWASLAAGQEEGPLVRGSEPVKPAPGGAEGPTKAAAQPARLA